MSDKGAGAGRRAGADGGIMGTELSRIFVRIGVDSELLKPKEQREKEWRKRERKRGDRAE